MPYEALTAWILRLRGLFSHKQAEREFAAEIDSHLQMHIDDNLRSSMTPQEARRNALLKLGGMGSTKEAYRERNIFLSSKRLCRIFATLSASSRKIRGSP